MSWALCWTTCLISPKEKKVLLIWHIYNDYKNVTIREISLIKSVFRIMENSRKNFHHIDNSNKISDISSFIIPFCWSSCKALLASDPRTFKRSETTEGVISLYCGTSLYNLSYVALSNNTWLFNLSRTFPFDHFYKFKIRFG